MRGNKESKCTWLEHGGHVQVGTFSEPVHPEKSSNCIRGTEALLFLTEGGEEEVMSFSSTQKATHIFCKGNLSSRI